MEPGRFAFIIHPGDASQYANKFPLTRHFPETVVENLFALAPAIKASYITGIKSEFNTAEGWFVGCTLTSRQFLRLPHWFVMRKIIGAARLAERLGAKIVGLGAYTAIIGDAGHTVANNVGIAVTTGNSYTVAAALEGAKLGAGVMGHDFSQAEVAVVGAYGSIGSACARILAREVKYLTLVGRNEEKLEALARQILQETGLAPRVSTDISKTLPKADVVIAVSSSVDAIIQPEDLKPGAVVCDVALPRDVDERVAAVRDDVLVMDGGVISVPGNVEFNLDFGFPRGHSAACMAETMLLALENRYHNFTLGRDLSVVQIDHIASLANKHGFKVAGVRSFHRAMDDGAFQKIRENARRKRARLLGQFQPVS